MGARAFSRAFTFFSRSRAPSSAELIARFLQAPEHSWIVRDRPLLDRVADFLCRLPARDLAKILEERRLLLLYCNQKMSAAFFQFRNREIVLVFPELRRLLLSAQYHQGFAILAHELGHILYGHSRRAVHPMTAQLEADQYAVELGFGEELSAVLQAESPSVEVLGRLSALRLR